MLDNDILNLKNFGVSANPLISKDELKILLSYKGTQKVYLVAKDIKLKNALQMRSLKYDRRLGGYLTWMGINEKTEECDIIINFSDIMGDLDRYNQARIEIIKYAQEIEDAILKMPRTPREANKKYYKFCTLFTEDEMSHPLVQAFIKMRNSFCHNQYPEFKDIYDDEEGEHGGKNDKKILDIVLKKAETCKFFLMKKAVNDCSTKIY